MIRALKAKKILALCCLICALTFLLLFCLLISQASLFTNKKSANLYIEQFFIEDDQYLQFLIFTPLGLRIILAHWVQIHSELVLLSKLKKMPLKTKFIYSEKATRM